MNTETDLINLADQTDDYIVEGYIDLKNMGSGDTVILRTYIAVDGVNQDKADELSFSGSQDIKVVRIPAVTVAYNGKFRATVTQIAGATLKSFPYTFIVQVMEAI